MIKRGENKIVRTAIPCHCGMNNCGILAHVKEGRVIKIEPADFPPQNRNSGGG